MPQPLRGAQAGAEFRPNPIADRPVAAASLANALAAWNLFEWDLTTSYSVALGFYLPGIQGWEPTNHPMAFDIMEGVAGLGTRLDLMEIALKRVAPQLLTDLVAIRPAIRREAGKRATLAHGKWGINDRFSNDIVRSEPGGGFTRWSAKDFQNCADAFFALRRDFQAFYMALRDAAKARHGLMQPPEPFR